MKDIHEEIDAIAELILSDETREELKKASEAMENSEEVQMLAQIFSLKQHEYSACLNHYNENSPEAKKLQKDLYEAKKKLDEHTLVKNYCTCLSRCNEPLRYLEYNLIIPLTNAKKGMC